MEISSKRKAAVLMVMGQSNAHGHGTKLKEEEQIVVPLTNVKGLNRADNQSFDVEDVTWSGFTTAGMNLGEIQDHTCCLANVIASMWQKAIDEQGMNLPDLYIIQISIGCQGIDNEEREHYNMWYPFREKVLKPGTLDTADISLYPLAIHILPLAMQNLREAGLIPEIIGLHWNQWETEVDTGGEVLLRAPNNYKQLFAGFRNALKDPFPIYLYIPHSDVYENPDGVVLMQELFAAMHREDPSYRLMDAAQSPYWNAQSMDKGIYQEDYVHYNDRTHRWFAEQQFRDYTAKLGGKL